MRKSMVLLAGCALATTANGAPVLTQHVPAAVRSHTAILAGAPAPDSDMDIAISLKLRDEAGLNALLHAIYTPGSPAWRQYISVAEFTARFGPTQADYAALVGFATAHNLQPRHLSANRLVLDLHGRVADIENALHVKIGLYRAPAQARLFYAPDRDPSPDIAVPILHISGLDNAAPPRPHAVHGVIHSQATGSGPLGNFIGSDLRAAYYGGTTRTGAGQSLALVEYAGYNPVDISNYFLQVHQTNKVPVKGVSLNGVSLSCTGTCSDFEQSLDIETALSIAPGLAQLVLYVGNTDVSILNQIAVDNSSKQISSSWGWPADATTLDPIFKEYAAQGQSYFNASGDQGDHLLAGGVWPADDQYVTGVGGTDLTTLTAGGPWLSETAWLHSGGGHSPDHIKTPSYQAAFVSTLNKGSSTLRNVPDVAAAADAGFYSCYNLICGGFNYGTSYAAPTWAAYIALVNEEAASLKKPAVGFLNPALYAIAAGTSYHANFHDPAAGNNGAYHAVKGYDLVTGLGTPNGVTLLQTLAGG